MISLFSECDSLFIFVYKNKQLLYSSFSTNLYVCDQILHIADKNWIL